MNTLLHDTQSTWDSIAEGLQSDIRVAIKRPPGLTPNAARVLRKLGDKPKLFVALLCHADPSVTVKQAQALYALVTGGTLPTKIAEEVLNPPKQEASPEVKTRQASPNSNQQLIEAVTRDFLSKTTGDLQKSIGALALAYDCLAPGYRTVYPEARTYLTRFTGNPRGFITVVVLATQNDTVSASAIERLHADVTGRGLDHTSVVNIGNLISGLNGPAYGLRKGSTGARQPPPLPPQPEPPTGHLPVGSAAPSPRLPLPLKDTSAWDTFANVLHLLIDGMAAQTTSASTPQGGVRIHKVGSSYVATLPDGTAVQVSKYGTSP